VKLVFIGTSDTAGIPVHFCDCLACNLYRKEKRYNTPTCAYIELDDGLIFIDFGSDEIIKIREEKEVFACFLTHFHGDHAYGLLRFRHTKREIICYHPEDELGFADVFQRPHSLKFVKNEEFKSVHIKGVEFTPIPIKHSRNTHGYLIKTESKTIAYLTDCSEIEKNSFEFLQKCELDAVFVDASYSVEYCGDKHLNYLQANKLIEDLKAKEGFLIHQSHYGLNEVIENKIELKFKYIPEQFEYQL
jgi:phosphoribosyl 1,2-cyclic phosphate phosphodiesterase